MIKNAAAVSSAIFLAVPAGAQDADCPVYETRNWHAWVDKGAGDGGTRLIVAGQLDFPTPGYLVEWVEGPLDRMQPPAFRLRVNAIPPDGMTLQAITSEDVMYKQPNNYTEYRAVLVFCGNRLLAEIPDVKLTD